MKKSSSKNKKLLKNLRKRDKKSHYELAQIFKVFFYFKIVRKIKTAKKVKNVTRIKNVKNVFTYMPQANTMLQMNVKITADKLPVNEA